MATGSGGGGGGGEGSGLEKAEAGTLPAAERQRGREVRANEAAAGKMQKYRKSTRSWKM